MFPPALGPDGLILRDALLFFLLCVVLVAHAEVVCCPRANSAARPDVATWRLGSFDFDMTRQVS